MEQNLLVFRESKCDPVRSVLFKLLCKEAFKQNIYLHKTYIWIGKFAAMQQNM